MDNFIHEVGWCVLYFYFLKSYDEVVARCDVMEEELTQVKVKLRQTERKLEELKVKYGIEEEDDEKSDDEEKVFEKKQLCHLQTTLF